MTTSKLPRLASPDALIAVHPNDRAARRGTGKLPRIVINPRVARERAAIDRLAARHALPDADDPRYCGAVEREIKRIINEEANTTQRLEAA